MALFERGLMHLARTLSSLKHRNYRLLSLYFMDKGLWSFGTLFIGSIAHVLGTPRAIAISGAACALAATALLYQQRQPRASQPAESLKRHITQ